MSNKPSLKLYSSLFAMYIKKYTTMSEQYQSQCDEILKDSNSDPLKILKFLDVNPFIISLILP